jgi:hypothetical protein
MAFPSCSRGALSPRGTAPTERGDYSARASDSEAQELANESEYCPQAQAAAWEVIAD